MLSGQLDNTAMYANDHLALSDISLKTNIEDVNLTECYQLLNNVNAKTYNRIDLEGKSEVGFIAQEIKQHASAKFENVVSTVSDINDNELLTLNYPKLVTV